MRRLLLILFTLFVILLAALLVVPFLIPTSVYRDRMEIAAESALGRDVTISEDISLSIFPRIEARSGAAEISNPDGFGDAAFAEMSELHAAVKLWPLFSKRVEIDEFVLVDPAIRLIKKSNGETNWTFDTAQPEAPEDDTDEGQRDRSFSAKLGDIRLVNGAITYRDDVKGEAHQLEKLNLTIGMESLDAKLSLDGEGELNAEPFSIDMDLTTFQDLIDGNSTSVSGEFKTRLASATMIGTLAVTDPLTMSLEFDADVPSITALADFVDFKDMPAAQALGAMRMKGHVEGAFGNLTLTLAELKHSGGLFNAEGAGVVTLSDVITTDLKLDAFATDLKSLAAVLDMDLPAIDALGSATFTTSVKGPIDNLSLTNMTFEHDSSLITAMFNGDVQYTAPKNGGTPRITMSGPFSLNAPRLRALASSADIELPDGDKVYRAFALSGNAKGDLTSISVSDASMTFDDIKATGNATLNMSPNRPLKLTGSLATNAIDATSYAVASGAIKDEQAAKTAMNWEDAPIELAFLDGVEVDLDVVADALKFQLLDFGRTRLEFSVKNGALVANLAETAFYNGIGDAKITANTVNGVPRFSLEADLAGVNFEPFLGALTQMNLVNGDGGMKISLSGEGSTMLDLMSTLTGSADFAINEGAIQGVDFSKFTSLSMDSFVSGEWRNALSQDASTNVKDFSSNFSINNGVATSKSFIFKTEDFRIPGQLKLDLGGRSLGLTLIPTSKDKSIGLNGELPPIMLTGPWGGDMQLGIDQSWIETKLKQAATDAITDEISKQIGDSDLGEIIGIGEDNDAQDAIRDILGIKSPPPEPATTPTPASEPAESSQEDETPMSEPPPTPTPSPTSLEDLAKDRLNKELGDLFK